MDMSANQAGKLPERRPASPGYASGFRAFQDAQRHQFGALGLSTHSANENNQALSDINNQRVRGQEYAQEYAREPSNFVAYENGQAGHTLNQGFGDTYHTQRPNGFHGDQNNFGSSLTNGQTAGFGQQTFNYRPGHDTSSTNNTSQYSAFQLEWQGLQAPGNSAYEPQSRDDRGHGAYSRASSSRTDEPHESGQASGAHSHHDNQPNVILPIHTARRHQEPQNWGLKCPLRPPTPSEGAAQEYNRYGVQKYQRTIVHNNGTCLSFAPGDFVDEVNFATEPFIDQILEIDTAVRNIQAERDLHPTAPEDPFNNFRDGREVPLDLVSVISLPGGQSRFQVPSVVATVLPTPSTYTQVAHHAVPEPRADTRYGTVAAPRHVQHRHQQADADRQIEVPRPQREHPNPQLSRPQPNGQNRRGGSASMGQGIMHRGPQSGPMQSQQFGDWAPRHHSSNSGLRRGSRRGSHQGSFLRPENSRQRRTHRRTEERNAAAHISRGLEAGETLPRIIDDGNDEAGNVGQVEAITHDIRRRSQFVGQGHGTMQGPLRTQVNSIGTQQRLDQSQGGTSLRHRGGTMPFAGSFHPMVSNDNGYQNWLEEVRRAGLMPMGNTHEPNGEFIGSGFVNNGMHMGMNASAFQPASAQRTSRGGGFSFPAIGMTAPSMAFNNGFQAPNVYVNGATYDEPLPRRNMGRAAAVMNSAYANGGESSSRGILAHAAPTMNDAHQSAFKRFESFAHEQATEYNDYFGQATLEEDDGFDNGGHSSLQEYAEFQSNLFAADQQRQVNGHLQVPNGAWGPPAGNINAHDPTGLATPSEVSSNNIGTRTSSPFGNLRHSTAAMWGAATPRSEASTAHGQSSRVPRPKRGRSNPR